MSRILAMLRRCWIVLWVGERPPVRTVPWVDVGGLASRRPDGFGHFGRPLAERSLGLCDACGVAWGVDIWLHPDQLLVTVLCQHHSMDQAVALEEHDWSRLVQPTSEAQVTRV